MSDQARSSVRTGARGGSGTVDEAPVVTGPVDGGRDRPDPGTGSSVGGAPAEARGAAASQSAAPVEAAVARQSAGRPADPTAAGTPVAAQGAPAQAAPASPPAEQPTGVPAPAAAAPPAAAPAPPAAHPVTPLAPPAKAAVPGARPADGAGRPVGTPAPPVPPSTGVGRAMGARSGVQPVGQRPVDATQSVTLPPTGARPVDQSPRPAARAAEAGSRTATEAPARGGKGRVAGKGPRRARLQLRHIDTWSALKISLVLSIALFCVWMVAVGILYGVLGQLGVFDTLNGLIGQLGSASGGQAAASDVINGKIVLGGAAVIGAVNIVLLTALCTVSAFVYNLCSDLVGGLEVTLAERD